MRYLLKTTGERVDYPEPVPFKQLHELLGAHTLDVVTLRSLGEPLHVMLVDDNGYETRSESAGNVMTLVPTKALKPMNTKATVLYLKQCVPGTDHAIVGDVFICPDGDYA